MDFTKWIREGIKHPRPAIYLKVISVLMLLGALSRLASILSIVGGPWSWRPLQVRVADVVLRSKADTRSLNRGGERTRRPAAHAGCPVLTGRTPTGPSRASAGPREAETAVQYRRASVRSCRRLPAAFRSASRRSFGTGRVAFVCVRPWRLGASA